MENKLETGKKGTKTRGVKPARGFNLHHFRQVVVLLCILLLSIWYSKCGTWAFVLAIVAPPCSLIFMSKAHFVPHQLRLCDYRSHRPCDVSIIGATACLMR
ncbi:MAG: hypothetical protein QXY74_08525 [Candidatus Bathyarchaeia archaeon]